MSFIENAKHLYPNMTYEDMRKESILYMPPLGSDGCIRFDNIRFEILRNAYDYSSKAKTQLGEQG